MHLAPRASPHAHAVPPARTAGHARLRPLLVVAFLIAGSAAAQAVSVESTGAQPRSSSSPIPAVAFRAGQVRSALDPTPERTPVVVPGVRPSIRVDTVSPTPEPTATPEPPAVVRFRPRDGWTDVSPWAAVSIRFTQPMDHASTEAVFAATIDGATLTGARRWAEGDTVLVLQPGTRLPYGATVRLSVAAGARSQAGGVLATEAAVTFTVVARPKPTPAPTPPPTNAPPAAPPATTRPAPVSGWQWPLNGPITQRFGESLTQYGVHQGIDIDGDTGDPVRAARAGTVTVAGRWDDCGGLEVHIDHGDGLSSWYRHLSRIDVAVGARPAGGAVIGAVGDTGCSLGSHLHFAIREGTTFVDPLRYLPSR